ncbi:aminotransferase class I/II-fold pyridoxal phosphate-dependent enzyme [Dolichospermum sp. ST_con]|nr:aminotransferase class I/II-fold pyridoxal phosphate-dependent enzyme [Dolichospermum sp. ST_con]MDD1420103.1 aminotransferase class I/II-fold pyridoxal phosphate-dependent enzyme [Dolichospermum sp. ST_sed1]MDD1423497.1 aminotransferase class I/II-fold pyridoxal phosphate-dependent enzyme [Dolichospermum sp. ST_sed9]MDD1431644.1 aminotransferase class I/II-fold pyridoxal phosphate-dependent enzyme [Dolichospermum sp. ST_sed6]MDD1440967.1 aminotransferase class I/II-fold pyridoxal phosphate-
MTNQNQTPLIDALKACTTRPHTPFYTPGHKRGAGISPLLTDLLGKDVFRADLTELAELDNLFTPQGVILAAQELAAEAFGAEKTWFLVNGSTCGIEAAILATCRMGDKIILPRNVHSSVISGLILSGAIPIFIYPAYNSDLDIAHSITPKSVKTALAKHPDAKAVLIVYPTYNGVCGDLPAIAHITHQYNIPLIVDEAHGAHFHFHPDLPTSALTAGADLTVQSIHKTLGAMTQASMLHIQGNRIDIDRINKALQLVQSTSPSFILLASLDAARQQMAIDGKKLLSQTLELANKARNKINQIPGLSILQPTDFLKLDQTRLTVNVSQLGITGFTAEDIINEMGVTPEFSSLQNLIFIISIGNTESDIQNLIQTLFNLTQVKSLTSECQPCKDKNDDMIAYFMCISPREAFFANSETLPIEKTLERICAEIICPYPPGIPVLMPGELITKTALEYLQEIQKMGGFITGCADETLQTIKVVKG